MREKNILEAKHKIEAFVMNNDLLVKKRMGPVGARSIEAIMWIARNSNITTIEPILDKISVQMVKKNTEKDRHKVMYIL